ncbi:bifunctional 3'-5' exonuclease/DNA polymerase [Subtercola boreus]|uniref:bifunctional 3'-5' exonuclease/DNA polymerase n=1 Tax=Subtercola boreus TaxID=120213 RepID=UPI00209BCD9D|nr:bifunctional 3'-5' exonuclease/DNA polymerase [Subtercola boreus]
MFPAPREATAATASSDHNGSVYVVISGAPTGSATLTPLDDSGLPGPDEPAQQLAGDDLAEAVEALELENPRWVWADTASRYGWLLAHGVRVDRCHDLRLTRAILRSSALSAGSRLALSTRGEWDATAPPTGPGAAADDGERDAAGSAVAFDFDGAVEPGGPDDEEVLANEAVAELVLQLDAIRTATEPNRLRLLIAAESAGALVAAEMTHAGLPWHEGVHDELLTELLGPEAPAGQRPARLEALAQAVRRALDAPQLNPDSPQELLRALRAAGLSVTTTRSWELQAIEHPVIPPLLEYKKLSRLFTANGWSWMASWVRDGRFHPDYLPGGVVSGRWAARGGGALQLPKQVRRAVTADDGWKLVVADAAQLEPRILAGISADTVMAAAGRGSDLYAGIVESGAVKTRAEAKVAMLGAMYGATSGESGRLLPRLARAFPTALDYVETAARAGERGEIVTSRLGRSAPRPAETWWETQALAREGAPDERVQQLARREARDWGRFTRNFVVQASAADWALCWLADLRRRLAALAPEPEPELEPELEPAAPDPSATTLAAPEPSAPGAGSPAATAAVAPAAVAPAAVASGSPAAPGPATAHPAHDGLAGGAAGVATDADASADATAAAELSPVEREAARIAAIEAEIAERERRKAADSPFKAADPVAAMAARLAELRSAGRSVRPTAAPAAAPAAAHAAVSTTTTGPAPGNPATAPATTAATPPTAPATSARPGTTQPPTVAAGGPGTAALQGGASTTALPGQAVTAALQGGAGTTALQGQAGTTALQSRAVTTALQGQAGTTALQGQAGTAALQGGASTAALQGGAGVGGGAAVVAGRAAAPFARAPHLVFFLHDEVIVHAPAALAEEVAEAIRASAASATRLLFGQFPLDVPLDISIVDSYADAD